jgi:signal transduction histidine kinase
VDEYLFGLYLFGSLILTLFAVTLAVVLVVQRQRQQKAKHEQLSMQLRHEAELLNSRIDVQEQSMSLISEELHDNVGQLLAVVKMNLNNLKARLEVAPQEAVPLVERTKEAVVKTINEVRHISHSLNSTLIQDVGLVQLLRRDTEFINESSGLRVTLDIRGAVVRLTPEKDLLIYRIMQELLQNTMKHAAASTVTIVLTYSSQQLVVSIRDDGKGFEAATIEHSGSLGLRNIRNRAALLGAELDIESEEGKGTKTVLKIPLPNTNGH